MHRGHRSHQQAPDIGNLLAEQRGCLRGPVPLQHGKVHVDGGEGCADFIVKFAADALAFLLLHLQHAHGLLVLANEALPLFDKTDAHRIGDAIGGRFVSIEHAVEQFEVVLIFLEQGAGQDVAQQQNNPQHFPCFHAPRDDTLGQVPGVGLQGGDAAGFQNLKVMVVRGRRFRKNLHLAHGREQLRLANAPGPFLAELGAVRPQVRHEFAQQLGAAFARRAGCTICLRTAHGVRPSPLEHIYAPRRNEEHRD